jgi:DNA-binding LacI/PurR family transcriptional regulator
VAPEDLGVTTTLKDVATRAGVSLQTVSNVIHGRDARVGVHTRARVLAAIEALRYRPNLSARHLRRGRVGVLALAIPDLTNSYFADIGNAVVAAAAARDYTVLLDHTRGDRTAEALVVNGLRPHLIDGVILSSQSLEPDDLAPDRVGLPIVLLGERFLGLRWDHVVIDNVAAAQLATTHLLGLGRRRIAAIGVPEDPAAETSHLRLRGFTDALAAAGQPLDRRLLAPAASLYRADGAHAHRADGAHAMRHLLALAHPPDAVFCFNDLLALGALRALHEAGCRIPDDVAVVGFDDIDEGQFATPSLTTIAPDKQAIGQGAVSLLLERIVGARTGPPQRVEPPFRLVVRESTVGAGADSTAASSAATSSAALSMEPGSRSTGRASAPA